MAFSRPVPCSLFPAPRSPILHSQFSILHSSRPGGWDSVSQPISMSCQHCLTSQIIPKSPRPNKAQQTVQNRSDLICTILHFTFSILTDRTAIIINKNILSLCSLRSLRLRNKKDVCSTAIFRLNSKQKFPLNSSIHLISSLCFCVDN